MNNLTESDHQRIDVKFKYIVDEIGKAVELLSENYCYDMFNEKDSRECLHLYILQMIDSLEDLCQNNKHPEINTQNSSGSAN